MDKLTEKLQELAREIPPEEWEEFDQAINRNRKYKWAIGDKVRDDDGNVGVVTIVWNDGDICTAENDADHSNLERIDVLHP